MAEYVIGAGTPADRMHLPLATKTRKPIRNEVRRERAPESLRAAVQLWARERPHADLRSISGTYNCMGFVFATRRTCIDIEELQFILVEDGYKRIAETDVEPGDLVVYQRDGQRTHVALVLRVDGTFGGMMPNIVHACSQWGADGEYFHRAAYVPSHYGIPAEYWTDRVNLP